MDLKLKDMEVADTEQMVSKEEVEKKTEPDSYLFIILFYFLGTACFVPQNFYITANEYWMYKFRDPDQQVNETDSEKTTMQTNFTAYSGIAGNACMVLFLFLTLVAIRKIPVQARILGTMTVMLVLFAITLLFIFIDTDSWQMGFFVIALGVSGLLSACTSVLLVSLFQLASRFPPRCLAAQLAGQSICGILGASVQIISLLAAPSVKATASMYYAIAFLVIAGTMVAYIVVANKSKVFKSKLEKKPQENKEPKKSGIKFDIGLMKRVFKKLALLIAALVLCVVTTGILNPGLTILIESSGKGTNAWSDTYFLPVVVFLLFNTFEFIGREVSNHIPVMKNIYVIFGTTVVRLALLPLLLLCNLQPKNSLPVVFHDDAYFIIFMILLAVSSGYILNIAIVVLPSLCEPEEKNLGMIVIVLVMILFVTVTAILSGVIVNLI